MPPVTKSTVPLAYGIVRASVLCKLLNGSPFLREKKPVCSKEAYVWYGIVTKKRLFVVAFRVPKRENRETLRRGRE